MKLIICGGRDYALTNSDLAKLDSIHARSTITEVVSGGAPGADAGGEAWATQNNIPIKHFKPDWNTYGKAAGPIRNQQMADYADACIAFPGGSGTKDMLKKATSANLYLLPSS